MFSPSLTNGQYVRSSYRPLSTVAFSNRSVHCALREHPILASSPCQHRSPWMYGETAWNAVKCQTSPSESVPTTSSDFRSNNAIVPNFLKFLTTLYAFGRPHTMKGTFISIVSVSYMALQSNPFSVSVMQALTWALSASLLMNIFIVGLNQVFDVKIDKINKPFLPIPAGDLTVQSASVICVVCLVGSLVIGWMSRSPPLMGTLLLSMVLGIAYSADFKFLRWKRNAFVAAICILTIRAVAVQLGFYLHMRYSLGLDLLEVSKPIVYTLFLFCYYSVVIALFKDIPDIKGDRQARMMTFTVRLGQENVFWICIWMLTFMYISAMVIGFSSDVLITRIAFPLGNVFSLSVLWKEALKLELGVKQNITNFYMLVWKLFYLQYFFIPFLRFSA